MLRAAAWHVRKGCLGGEPVSGLCGVGDKTRDISSSELESFYRLTAVETQVQEQWWLGKGRWKPGGQIASSFLLACPSRATSLEKNLATQINTEMACTVWVDTESGEEWRGEVGKWEQWRAQVLLVNGFCFGLCLVQRGGKVFFVEKNVLWEE